MGEQSRDGFHIASLAHAGRLWTAYLEFDDDPHAPRSYRARIRFEPTAGGAADATRTAVIIIEDSFEEAKAKARAFDERQLAGLLRSTLPDDEAELPPGDPEIPGTGPTDERPSGDGAEGGSPVS
jgi:hypothetical protein